MERADEILYKLKRYYETLITLLETQFSSSYIVLRPDKKLNTLYLKLILKIEDTKDSTLDIALDLGYTPELLSTVVREYKRPFPDLYSIVNKDSQGLWQVLKVEMQAYQSIIEEAWLSYGEITFELSKGDKELIDKIIGYCNSFSEGMGTESKKWQAVLDNHFHSNFSFDKSNKRPRLTIDHENNLFSFSANGNTQKSLIRSNTNEYKILMFLLDNKGKAFETGDLANNLKEMRQHMEDENKKQRVIDTITAIRNKLGKELIETTASGYKVDCEVVRI